MIIINFFLDLSQVTLAYNLCTKASYAIPLISFLCRLLYGLLHLYNFFFVSQVLCYLLFFFPFFLEVCGLCTQVTTQMAFIMGATRNIKKGVTQR